MEGEEVVTGGKYGKEFDDNTEPMVVGGFQDMFAGGAKKVREGYDSYGLYDTSSRKTKGRYISKTPSSAAKKAARRLFQKASKGTRELTVYIRKTTRGSKREIYRYKAVLEVLRTPLIVNKEGTKIEVKNKVKVVSEDLPPSVAAVMNAKKDMEKEKMMKKKEAMKAKRAKAAEKARVKKTKKTKKAKKPKAAKKPKSAKKSKGSRKSSRKGSKKSKRMSGGGCGMGSCSNLYV